jgi:hypothetical protein
MLIEKKNSIKLRLLDLIYFILFRPYFLMKHNLTLFSMYLHLSYTNSLEFLDKFLLVNDNSPNLIFICHFFQTNYSCSFVFIT